MKKNHAEVASPKITAVRDGSLTERVYIFANIRRGAFAVKSGDGSLCKRVFIPRKSISVVKYTTTAARLPEV